MKWTLLRSAADLGRFRDQLAAQWGLAGLNVDWGGDPTGYPALAAAHRVAPARILAAYVYAAAARALLAEAGPVPPAPDAGGPARQLETHERRLDLQKKLLDDQIEYNKSLNAHLLTVMHHLERVGICDGDQYKADYVRHLAAIDRWYAEDKDRVLHGAALGPGPLPQAD